jgi:hypothetical protein
VPDDDQSRVRNRHIVESLESALRSGSHGLTVVPELLKRCLREQSWREFTTTRNELVVHDDFALFLTTSPLKGLGADLALVRRLVSDDPEAAGMLDKALHNAEGNSAVNGADSQGEGNTPDPGSAGERALRRLRATSPEIHAQVVAGELSTHAAMVQAGLRKRTVSVALEDPQATARSLLRRMEPEHIATLIRALQEAEDGQADPSRILTDEPSADLEKA